MCWSLAASASMVAVGSAATVFAVRRRLPTAFPVALGYFTLMEGLQSVGYLVVDGCGEPVNRAVTLLSYLHIAFQPFFINALALELVPAQVRSRVWRAAHAMSAVSAAVMLAQLMDIDGTCRIGQPLCGTALCLRSGTWHIAWDVPYNGLMEPIDRLLGLNLGFPTYFFATFVMPLLYGSWRFVLVNLAAGPVLANVVTKDVNEVPAIWCLFSIAIIVLAAWPRLLELVRVERWPLWPRHWRASGASRAV